MNILKFPQSDQVSVYLEQQNELDLLAFHHLRQRR